MEGHYVGRKPAFTGSVGTENWTFLPLRILSCVYRIPEPLFEMHKNSPLHGYVAFCEYDWSSHPFLTRFLKIPIEREHSQFLDWFKSYLDILWEV